MNNFEILLSSPFDREFLVAEIWFGNEYIAEVNQEESFLKLDIHMNEKGLISLPLDEFLNAIELAKKKLIGDE